MQKVGERQKLISEFDAGVQAWTQLLPSWAKWTLLVTFLCTVCALGMYWPLALLVGWGWPFDLANFLLEFVDEYFVVFVWLLIVFLLGVGMGGRWGYFQAFRACPNCGAVLEVEVKHEKTLRRHRLSLSLIRTETSKGVLLS